MVGTSSGEWDLIEGRLGQNLSVVVGVHWDDHEDLSQQEVFIRQCYNQANTEILASAVGKEE